MDNLQFHPFVGPGFAQKTGDRVGPVFARRPPGDRRPGWPILRPETGDRVGPVFAQTGLPVFPACEPRVVHLQRHLVERRLRRRGAQLHRGAVRQEGVQQRRRVPHGVVDVARHLQAAGALRSRKIATWLTVEGEQKVRTLAVKWGFSTKPRCKGSNNVIFFAVQWLDFNH